MLTPLRIIFLDRALVDPKDSYWQTLVKDHAEGKYQENVEKQISLGADQLVVVTKRIVLRLANEAIRWEERGRKP